MAPSDSPPSGASGWSMSSSSARTRARTRPAAAAAGAQPASRRRLAPDARDQAQAPAGGARPRDALERHVAQALLLDVGRRDAGVHGDVGQRRRLAGRVPAVDVVARVGLGVAVGLGLGEGVVEAAPGRPSRR